MILPKEPISGLVERCETWNPRERPSGYIDYIDLSSVDKDTKSIRAFKRIKCSEAPSRARQLVAAGDILVSTVRPNLNGVALVSAAHHGMTASTGYTVLRPKRGKLDSRYLFHWVRTDRFVRRMVAVATGANYPAVSDAKVKASVIPLPTLSEQKRIAAILDAADDLRRTSREALAHLDLLVRATFFDMFGDPVTNSMGWRQQQVIDVCEQVVDCVNRTAPVVEYTTPYKMIRTSNIRHGVVDTANVRYVNQEIFHRWNRRLTPAAGDVLLTREAPVGEAGVIRGNECVFLGQRIMLYRVNPQKMTPEYLLYSFMGEGLQRQFTRSGSGSTVKHLPLPACRSFLVLTPPVDLQQRFSAVVEAVEKQMVVHRTHLAELDTLFGSLQHRAFAGGLSTPACSTPSANE